MSYESAFEAAREKLEADGAGRAAVESFARFHRHLAEGEQGLIAESAIEPVAELPDAERLPEADASAALERTVMIKLNGGLGTGMGMTRAKSLIEAKDGLSFLDVIARQVLLLRERTGARLPLVLMDSFATRDDALAALAEHDGLATDGLALDFLQNRVPKLRADDLHPVAWEPDQSLEWAPPEHGDIYAALVAGNSHALSESDVAFDCQ